MCGGGEGCEEGCGGGEGWVCVEEEKVAYTDVWEEVICGPYQDS